MAETHINAFIARVAELRQQANALNGEADQVQQYIDSVLPPEVKPKEAVKRKKAKKVKVVTKTSKGKK